MSTVLRALLLSALLTLVPVGVGVSVSEDTTITRKPAVYQGTDLEDYDTAAAVVQRTSFCELVATEAIEAALGESVKPQAYGNGEESDVLPGNDVAHEYGCQFTLPVTDGSPIGDARAWVFAPPVSPERAQPLVAAAATKQCKVQTGAPAYGSPSVATLCTVGDVRTASFRGLFGDAWLACSLTLPPAVDEAELLSRAGRWCVAVAQAASATPS